VKCETNFFYNKFKIMSNLIGSFYFELTANGNLIGEFSNNLSKSITTENANLSGTASGFIGKYESTWYDDDVHFANLVISQRVKNKIYVLQWNENGKLKYKGEGFLHDKTLIGYYIEL
jgi:hypothetical protein